ncbi:MAG: hypothetical protein K8E66_10480, partial [Phycisphaerales bacterium]|nr:hypothetical protein [Phycisphaerales bacterium]
MTASIPTQGGKIPKPGKGRNRRSVRRTSEPWIRRLTRLAEHPSAGWGLVIGLVFMIVVGSLVAWSREQPQLVAKRTARSTRTVRVEFDALNAQQTEQKRANARQTTPRVYRASDATIDSIVGEIERLPSAAILADSDQTGSDAQSFFRGLNLSAETSEALRSVAADPAALTAWAGKAAAIRGILLRNPILERADWERARTEGLSRQPVLITDGIEDSVPRDQVINIDDPGAFSDKAATLSRIAGFEAPLIDAVAAVLGARSEPTFMFDSAMTTERQEAQAALVQPVVDKRAVGQTIFTRGDIITPTQLLMYEQELTQFREHAASTLLWGRRLGVAAVVAVCTIALAIALATLSPSTVQKPARLGWIAGLIAFAVATSAVGTIVDPTFIALTSTAPVALIAVLIVTVFDRLVAAVVGVITALLVSLALTPMHGY